MDAEIEYTPAPDDAFPPRPPSYLDQNYAVHVFRDFNDTPGNDILAAAHPNGIAFLTLAPSHAALRQAGLGDSGEGSIEPNTSARLVFELPEPPAERSGGGRGRHRMGKKGRAADVYMTHGHTFARLICGGESSSGGGEEEGQQREWVLSSPLKGRLVEANAALEGLHGVELLKALRDGYLAVVEVKTGEVERAAHAARAAAAQARLARARAVLEAAEAEVVRTEAARIEANAVLAEAAREEGMDVAAIMVMDEPEP